MQPHEAARVSLLGLAVGDAFGAMLDRAGARRAAMRLISPQRPWKWTDDTAMALSIVELLADAGTIDPDRLAALFAARFAREPDRGYGAGAAGMLARVAAGAEWHAEATGLFDGKGSYGNGAAMRAAPIGAFFAPDLERVRDEALRSARPTHAHRDGAAGAVAVAIAAALACGKHVRGNELIAEAAAWTPPSRVRERLERARELGIAFDVQFAGEELGTGANISAHDTVPFAVWAAARNLDVYEEALWTALAHPDLEIGDNAIGVCAIDRDTIGAIVGGIVACAVGIDGIPVLWRAATEPLR
jgi:ADP-ribosylglycohydrolase